MYSHIPFAKEKKREKKKKRRLPIGIALKEEKIWWLVEGRTKHIERVVSKNHFTVEYFNWEYFELFQK